MRNTQLETTEGSLAAATQKKVRTVFSPSPIHLLVSEDALILKNVDKVSCAIALPIRVFP